jgi:hypothetical protein
MLNARSRRALLALVCLALWMVGCRGRSIVITLDRADLQRRMDAAFPWEKSELGATVRLEHPSVILSEASDRVGLELGARVSLPFPFSREYSGKVASSGKLTYQREEKAFYLREATLDRLEIDGVPPEQTALVRQPLAMVVSAALGRLPVYELGDSSRKEAVAGYFLREVRVKNGKVEAELDPLGAR